MDAATTIRSCLARVSQLRGEHTTDTSLGNAVREVKRFQARRFSGSYADLPSTTPYGRAARFFLDELYGEKDYVDRDTQFGHIAGTIQRLFPAQVAGVAVGLAQLHARTEELDGAMGRAWLAMATPNDARRYVSAWRAVGEREARVEQLQAVTGLGRELGRLTRTPGLRMMLRMMRGPAAAAGLGSLQRFLESGFDTFGALGRDPGGTGDFLKLIELRESALIALLFDADLVACETGLERTLGQAR